VIIQAIAAIKGFGWFVFAIFLIIALVLGLLAIGVLLWLGREVCRYKNNDKDDDEWWNSPAKTEPRPNPDPVRSREELVESVIRKAKEEFQKKHPPKKE